MTRTVVNRSAAAPVRGGVPRVHDVPSSPREAAQALDRRTSWPVHRIRCFLLCQPGQARRRTPAA